MPKKPARRPPRPTKANPLTPRVPAPRIDVLPRPTTPRPAPPKPAPPKPAPRVPTAARDRGEKLIARLLELDHKVDADFYQIGKVLLELASPDIFQPLGYTSFMDLVAKRDLPKRNQAYRLVAIASHLNADTARRLGIERAYNTVAYSKLAYPDQSPAAVVRRDPTIRIGPTAYKLSTLPSRLFRQLLQDTAHDLSAPPPVTLQRTARSLSQRLHHAGLEAVHVKSHHRGSKSYITIRLPLAEAQKLAAKLD